MLSPCKNGFFSREVEVSPTCISPLFSIHTPRKETFVDSFLLVFLGLRDEGTPYGGFAHLFYFGWRIPQLSLFKLAGQAACPVGVGASSSPPGYAKLLQDRYQKMIDPLLGRVGVIGNDYYIHPK